MKRLKSITIIFLISNLSGCSYNPDVKEDVETIANINSNVQNIEDILIDSLDRGNIYYENYTEDFSSYNYNLSVKVLDTIYALAYTNTVFQNKSEHNYLGLLFSKSYSENNKYHVLEIFNDDTLYHFTSLNPIENSRFFKDYTFKKGKYFFMFQRSREYETFGQEVYFYNHYDSLVNVSGNVAPSLPSIDSISMEEFYESKFYKNLRKSKPYLK